jgi:tetratricopeptide (TPR) repeat protein
MRGLTGVAQATNQCMDALMSAYVEQKDYSGAMRVIDDALASPAAAEFAWHRTLGLRIRRGYCLGKLNRRAEALALLKQCNSGVADDLQQKSVIQALLNLEEWDRALPLIEYAEKNARGTKPTKDDLLKQRFGRELRKDVSIRLERDAAYSGPIMFLDQHWMCLHSVGRSGAAIDEILKRFGELPALSDKIEYWLILNLLDRDDGARRQNQLKELLRNELDTNATIPGVLVDALLHDLALQASYSKLQDDMDSCRNFLRLYFLVRQKWSADDSSDELIRRGKEFAALLTGLGEYADAEDILRELTWRIEQRPGGRGANLNLWREVQQNLFVSLLNSKDSVEEANEVMAVLDKIPTQGESHFWYLMSRARFLAETGRFKEARATINDLYLLSDQELKPIWRLSGMTQLGTVETLAGRYDKALELFNKVLAHSKDAYSARSLALAKMAECYRRKGEIDKAFDCMKEFLDLSKTRKRLHLADMETAVEFYQKLGKVDAVRRLQGEISSIRKEFYNQWAASGYPGLRASRDSGTRRSKRVKIYDKPR